jgi:hypothetical protein
LARLGIAPEKWLNLSQQFAEHFTSLVGDAEHLQNNVTNFSYGKTPQHIRDSFENKWAPAVIYLRPD